MSQQINLFNPLFLKQQKYFSVKAMSQAFGLILLGAALIIGFAQYQMSRLSLRSEEAKKEFAAAQVKFALYEKELSPQQSNAMLEEELQKLRAKIATNEEVLKTLKSGVMGNTLGFSEYMRAFSRQAVSGLWLTGFEIDQDGKQISLTGAAMTPQLVPAYIRRLSNEPIMRGKTFGALQIQQAKSTGSNKNYLEFNIQSSKASVQASPSPTPPALPSIVELTSAMKAPQ
jgi:Tfp pilus assembly protein PilN